MTAGGGITAAPRAAGAPGPDGGGDTAARLRAIVAELSGQFLERSEVARMLVVAMLSRQHSLVLGPPGTAKSEIARELTGRVDGARMWEILLSRFTSPTSMFGPIDVAALATEGRYTQVFDGRATTAHIAFVDEIFKCSPAALNAMLAFLNERVYHPEGGGDPVACPLISAVCASNELPDGEETGAIYDRLLVRLQVGYLADPSNFAALMRSAVTPAAPPARTTVTLAELTDAVTAQVPRVQVPDGAVDAVCQLRASLRRQQVIASDRRWKASVRLLQASAWLAGRTAVGENDLQSLAHVLWESPAHRSTVEREVLQLVNPHAREAVEIGDALDELAAQLDSKSWLNLNQVPRIPAGVSRGKEDAGERACGQGARRNARSRPPRTAAQKIAACRRGASPNWTCGMLAWCPRSGPHQGLGSGSSRLAATPCGGDPGRIRMRLW